MISIEFDTKGMERILSPLAGLPKEITKALKLAARRTGQSLRSARASGLNRICVAATSARRSVSWRLKRPVLP